MTRTQFRKILWLSAFIALLMAVIGGYYGYLLGQDISNVHGIMMADKELQSSITNALNSLSAIKMVNSTVSAIAIILSIVSWVGLYIFWSPARNIFAINLPITYIIAPVIMTIYSMAMQSELPPEFTTPRNIPILEAATQTLIAISACIHGGLLVVLFSGLSKILFISSDANKNT